MKNALAVLFGLAMALVLAELGMRVVSRFHAPVRYLVTAGDAPEQPVFPTLEAYLASRPDVVPHRDFLNYWNNAFGLNDVEFVAPKPRGRFRIMALGDSFTYGSAPYPDAVMTRVEEALRARCAGMDLDLLNFGIGGTGVWDYKLLFELAGPTFDPDLVVVNLYLGNDGPDLFARPRSFRRVPSSLRKSYLARYVVNVVRVATGVDRHVVAEAVSLPRWSPPPHARGGEIVDAAAPLRPDDRQLTGPIYTRGEVPRDHVGRVSTLRAPAVGAVRGAHVGSHARDPRPPPPPSGPAGQPHGDRALSLGAPGVPGGTRPAPRKCCGGGRSVTGLAQLDVDPLRPNRVVLEYCRATELACYDTTADLVAASRQSTEPLYKVLDTHWTVRGNHVAAASQARWLPPIVCPEA